MAIVNKQQMALVEKEGSFHRTKLVANRKISVAGHLLAGIQKISQNGGLAEIRLDDDRKSTLSLFHLEEVSAKVVAMDCSFHQFFVQSTHQTVSQKKNVDIVLFLCTEPTTIDKKKLSR